MSSPLATKTDLKWLLERDRAYYEEAQRPLQEAKELSGTLRASGRCGHIDRMKRKRGQAQGNEYHVCERDVFRQGLCRMHYLEVVLKIKPYQAGRGKKWRPFAGWQLPGKMTDKDYALLEALPIKTPYVDCIEQLNKRGRKKDRFAPRFTLPSKLAKHF